jgi:hypothetical protein
MHQHDSGVRAESALPTDKPQQLTLPGIESRTRFHVNTYLIPVYRYAALHRVPVLISSTITGLYLIGQGTVATGLLFAVALFVVNALVDNQMRQGDE